MNYFQITIGFILTMPSLLLLFFTLQLMLGGEIGENSIGEKITFKELHHKDALISLAIASLFPAMFGVIIIINSL